VPASAKVLLSVPAKPVGKGRGGRGAGRGGGLEEARVLNGWTVVWVGEHAFRAPAPLKTEIEELGFMVKVYRAHDKVTRVLDKKPYLPPTNVFVTSEADARPILEYFSQRGASEVRIIIEANSPGSVPALAQSLIVPQDAMVTVAATWDEVMSALYAVSSEVASRNLMVAVSPSDMAETYASQAMEAQPAMPSSAGLLAQPLALSASAIDAIAANGSWTLIWVSDQAFKPTATQLKAQLEALGGQVKGYKTHKNAARALDKKRALVRTVVLVMGSEAPQLVAYLQSRPELAGTRVVVESQPRAAPIREGPTCQVADGFEGAISMVRSIVGDPTFQ